MESKIISKNDKYLLIAISWLNPNFDTLGMQIWSKNERLHHNKICNDFANKLIKLLPIDNTISKKCKLKIDDKHFLGWNKRTITFEDLKNVSHIENVNILIHDFNLAMKDSFIDYYGSDYNNQIPRREYIMMCKANRIEHDIVPIKYTQMPCSSSCNYLIEGESEDQYKIWDNNDFDNEIE